MTWQKRARFAVAIFGIVCAGVVYSAIGERQGASPPPVLKRLARQLADMLGTVDFLHLGQLRQPVECLTDRLPLPEDQAVLLFQSVRELLINVRKHAGTHQAAMTIEREQDDLRITVRDEGAGMDITGGTPTNQPSATSSKFGLFSIRERMLAIGGRLEIESSPGPMSRTRWLLRHLHESTPATAPITPRTGDDPWPS